MKTLWQKAMRRKGLTFVLLIIVLIVGYYVYKKQTAVPTETRYVLSSVAKGTVVASVSGTGQVSVSNQVDVKAKASGDVVSIPAAQGQMVYAGQLLAQLDATDAQKSVRDAQVNLESAQLSLDKAKQSSADITSIVQSSFATISNAFLDFPTITTGANDIILGNTMNPRTQDNASYYKDVVGQLDYQNYLKISSFVTAATNDFNAAQDSYDDALVTYKNTDRTADAAGVQVLLTKALATAQNLAQALKSEQNLLDYLTDYVATYNKPSLPTLVTTYKNNIRTYLGQINTHLSNLTTASSNIKNAPLDLQTQELSLKQRENSLLDAKETLANSSIRAPFSGVLAKLNVKRGDSISSGFVVGTVITPQKIAQITLNEVDIAKVTIGQKATLTFDAAPDITITGSVTQIDTIGTVSQGVVTYSVTITFDTQDDRVRPGMSVSAAIITATKTDVLVVPNAAVKTQGGTSYVEMLEAYQGSASSTAFSNQGVTSAVAPVRQTVTAGLASDALTEITNGLKEGDVIVSRTITAAAATAQTTGTSAFRLPGVGGATRSATGR